MLPHRESARQSARVAGGHQSAYGGYPLVNVYSLLLEMAIEIVDLPMKHGDFPVHKMLVDQRVLKISSHSRERFQSVDLFGGNV